MKKIYTAAFLLIFTPLTYATGFPCAPLFSADVMSEMIKDIADAVEQAKAKGLTK
ncbi:hypothetical protein ACVZZ1_002448 [Escherichia coli]